MMLFLTFILILSTTILFYYFKKGTVESLEIRLINWSDNISLAIAENPAAFRDNPASFIYSATHNEFISGSVLVQFMDRKGHLLAKSPSLMTNDLPYQKGQDNLLQDVHFSDGLRLKCYQDKLIVNRHIWGYIIVAIPITQTYHNLTRLRDLMIIVMCGTVIILGIGIHTLVNVNILQNQKLFLSFASHELRTPLAIILGHSEVALRHPHTEEDYRTTLALIQNEADWMSRLVSNLLFVFRSQSGTEILIKKSFDFGELVAESASTIKTLYPHKKMTLTLPNNATLIGDQDRLRQVVNNLVENAAKNTPENGLITLTLAETPKLLVFEVKDNGVGIEKKKQKKIFNAFYRVDENTKGGMGLGLAISQWIVKRHKGKIEVKSILGEGSVFTVSLPKGALP